MILVWWFDCSMLVWLRCVWCDSFVCECCECIQIEEIAKKCKTKNRPQKISLTFKFFCNISPNTATRGFPEDLWRLEENVFSRHLVCLRVSLCIYWRPWRAKVLFFILLYQKKIYNIKKSSGSSGNITNIHTTKPKHGWRLSWEGLQILRFSLQGLQEHKQQIERIWIQQNFCFLLNIFLRLKYQKNMAPKKSKVKKRVAQPAKGIIERTVVRTLCWSASRRRYVSGKRNRLKSIKNK